MKKKLNKLVGNAKEVFLVSKSALKHELPTMKGEGKQIFKKNYKKKSTKGIKKSLGYRL